VRHERDPRDPFFEGHFDMWGCAEPRCPGVMHASAQKHRCRGCKSLVCHGCWNDDVFESICKYCDAFLCFIGECDEEPVDVDGHPPSFPCDVCGWSVCLQCEQDSDLLPCCNSCYKLLCRDCEQKPGAGFTLCHSCDEQRCPDCPSCTGCTGSEGRG